jgi:hypothetical protein
MLYFPGEDMCRIEESIMKEGQLFIVTAFREQNLSSDTEDYSVNSESTPYQLPPS